MPARKRPIPEDAVTARRVLLDGLTRDADVLELVSELQIICDGLHCNAVRVSGRLTGRSPRGRDQASTRKVLP
jgi:hypothetical protein